MGIMEQVILGVASGMVIVAGFLLGTWLFAMASIAFTDWCEIQPDQDAE